MEALLSYGGNQLPVDEVALACGTIGYELLCAIAASGG